MSITQWKAIYDRLAALEAKVAELEKGRFDQDEVADGFRDSLIVNVGVPIKRGPGRPRKVIDG